MLTVGEVIALSKPKEIALLRQFLTRFANDDKEICDILAESHKKQSNNLSLEMIKSGHLSEFNIIYSIVRGLAQSVGVDTNILSRLLSNCKETEIITASNFGIVSFLTINKSVILNYYDQGILDNAISLHLLSTISYAQDAVYRILVDSPNGEGTGTGFICRDPRAQRNVSYLVTAKHNVDPAAVIIKEISAVSWTLENASDLTWCHHPDIDISISPILDFPISATRLPLFPICPVLTEVITLGFPTIPNCKHSHLLAHKGEVNGNVTSYLQSGNFLLISNAVSPGSSGSPVLNKLGSVVAIVTNSFERKDDISRISVQAALDSQHIIDLISERFP
ncbi:serine protease [Methylopila sp. M107]|uniref:S1 family peptidase n=1 Tax=Methylopila sp. M107 TaxID=1101190 RepID=UPI0012DF0247|nr:serine protease [Methylopila sp. M107]